MRRGLLAVVAVLIALSACSKAPDSPSVPNLPGGSGGADAGGRAQGNPNGVAGDGSAARRTALHNAAECIRQHGVPKYQDPVLTPDGLVYTDARTLEDTADDATRASIESACGELIRAAKFDPADQAPAPPKLVQAGVKVAECLRAHGLPGVKDPTANSHFTPGHGFGHGPGELPGGKDDAFMRATEACKAEIAETNRLSSLGNLG